jgi:hypothetical protein
MQILVRKPRSYRPFGSRWEGNSKIDLKEKVYENVKWIKVAIKVGSGGRYL